MKNAMVVPQKIRYSTATWSNNSTSGLQNQEDWDICTPIFTAALFSKPKRKKETQVSADRWMDKQSVIYIKWSSIQP